jgi:hypothetical protein
MATKKAEPNVKKEGDNEDIVKQLKAVTDALAAEKTERESMLNGLRQLAQVVKGQRDVIENLQKAPARTEPDPKKASKANDQDIEALSRKDFLGIIMGEVGDLLDDKLKGISDRVESVSSEFETKSVREEVQRAEGKFKDFASWKTEVAQELKRVPDLSVEDAYFLAKQKHPDKAVEIQKGLDKAEKEEEEARRASTQGRSPFGGMRPSGGGEVNERDDMEPDEAAEKAWEDIEESLGGKSELNKVLGMET